MIGSAESAACQIRVAMLGCDWGKQPRQLLHFRSLEFVAKTQRWCL